MARESLIFFSFHDLAQDARSLAQPVDVYLRIVGTLAIEVAGKRVYPEVQFCLVEFAIESQIWSRMAVENPSDFIYTSLEAEEQGLVWIRSESGGWRVGSVFQQHPCPQLFSFGEIVAALDDYYEQLRSAIKEKLDIDIAHLFEWRARQLRG